MKNERKIFQMEVGRHEAERKHALQEELAAVQRELGGRRPLADRLAALLLGRCLSLERAAGPGEVAAVLRSLAHVT